MALKRHRVALRRSHVRYRMRTWLHFFWLWSRRVFFLALAGWLGGLGYAFWARSPHLRLRDVSISPDAPAALAQRIGLSAGDHIFGFSARALERRLEEEFPQLAQVTIRRGLDRGLRVTVQKRRPAARLWQEEKGWFGMDRAGVVFPLEGPEERYQGLPVLAGVPGGKAADAALAFLERLQNAESAWTRRLAKVKASPYGEATLYLEDGAAVVWGPLAEDKAVTDAKIARLERVFQDEAAAGGLEYARFVDERRVVVKPAAPPEAADPKKKKG